ncbi:hypothetical protein BGZ76_001153 [Entomortierella beljakovae]|nr:hypothetical protein BGZ76_001153 [Entomortierella beljakovae]
MDLNWCPVCEQHIPIAWESSLYCSDRCKKADASLSAYPSEAQSFTRNNQRSSVSYASPSYKPISSPSLTGYHSTSSAPNAYPSPPTSPMSNYVYNKTSNHNGISPPSFSLGQPDSYDLQLRRKSLTTITVPQYTASSKRGYFQ